MISTECQCRIMIRFLKSRMLNLFAPAKQIEGQELKRRVYAWPGMPISTIPIEEPINNHRMNPFKLLIFFTLPAMVLCGRSPAQTGNIRSHVDTIGFAQYAWQMDSIMERLGQQEELPSTTMSTTPDSAAFRLVICPHDDYAYAGPLYPALLRHIKAPIVILFGVAHKARALGIENHIVFGSYSGWKEPYGVVPVSSLRTEIIRQLDSSMFIINDTLQKIEHSLEAILPFLQYYNRRLEIVPILVPAMPFERMQVISGALAGAIKKLAANKGWIWGRDYAIVVSTDAVHYGDTDWGGKNFAGYGVDSAGYMLAVKQEKEIIGTSLTGQVTEDKIRKFSRFTVDPEDYREYRWTWCGRYSVPFGLLTGMQLADSEKVPLNGILIGYATSIDHPRLPIEDLRMGITAGASLRHWVGYAAVGYK
jgi:AmmeMemoRadiSam system protein B